MPKLTHPRPRTRAFLYLAPIIAAVSAAPLSAAPTVIDFEDFPAGTNITAQYGPRGVVFQNLFLDTDAAAHSGTHVLRTASLSSEIFTPIVMVMDFTSNQARVKLFAESTGVALNGTLTAFDAANQVVASDGPRLVAANVFTTSFEVIDPDATPSIVHAELALDNGIYFAIDDLEFDGEPPASPPPTPPVVAFTAPVNGSEIDVTTLDITGTVTGQGLLPTAHLTLVAGRPPGSTAPPFTSDLSLTGTGTTRQFSLPGFTGVPLGPITITVTAENFANQQGSGSVTFTNLPVAIRNRFLSEGGATTFGTFRFGIIDSNCRIAVYDLGAISVDNAGNTSLIRSAIFVKWLALLSPSFAACPDGEEREGPPGSRVQDFDGGRIFAAPTVGTFLVPPVFVNVLDAIDRRGQGNIGVPTSDTTNSVGVMQSWLFQQFTRIDRPDLLPTTLEIRGTPPTLLLERQGGDWIVGSLEASAASRALNKTAPTLWESFPCNDLLGPCTLSDPPPFPPPNTPNAGDLFCNGLTYIPTLEGFCALPESICTGNDCCIPPEWVGIRGDYVATPVFGAIVSAHMTDIDNGFTHETHNGNCPFFPNILEVVSDVTCVSDFEFFVRPIGAQVDTSPLPSLFGKSNTDNIKTEYEVAYAAAAHNFVGTPSEGDLVHMTGRWIIDCGHDSFKSELHPLFSYAIMKTVVSETNAFTGLEDDLGIGGRPATRVGIWVNGWYPGGDSNAIEFDVFPPPRPSPDSLLHVIKPVDFAPGGYIATEDVSMEFAFEPPGAADHVHLRFTAPRRENTVTSAGEMKFESGRQYWGIWYVYWGN